MAVRGSTADAEHRRAAVDETIATFGSLDVLVNNAATNKQFGPLVDGDLDAVRGTIDANTMAPLGWVQEAWRAWMQDHGGSILNISSVGAFRVGGFVGAYNISKAGLEHLTRQLALELAPTVRVNGLSLGLVRTHFSRALLENGEDAIIAAHPMKRLGLPEDIAAAAMFLLSDEASWVTGQVLVVDGGGTSLGSVGDVVTTHLPFAAGRT
jgi:3-oxoacyl-[acyl-carrier protein] reductase